MHRLTALKGSRLAVCSAAGSLLLYRQVYADSARLRSDSDRWEDTTKLTLGAVVSLRMATPCSFDTFHAGNGRATGFVVDMERGLILTNRHVVGAGPIEGEAIFQNNEVVPVTPVYSDPVHDFGILSFDPSLVKYHKLSQLELCPDAAEIGTEIRVIGSDAGEKISVNTGILADLEREAPRYGMNTYNDFNTFYFKAASSTTGGSSGSPVIDVNGSVVALNAGGKVGTAAGFYLPLNSVERAIRLIQQDKPVSRGTLQTVWHHVPFEELRRLGLAEQMEQQIRAQNGSETGMLAVSEVVPGGPADGVLQPGDVLLEILGQSVTRFDRIEEWLDSNVGSSINIRVCRAGQEMELELTVDDLHRISPSEFLSFGGAVVNPLSYQQARNRSLQVGAPYVAHSGFLLRQAAVPDGSIITAINYKRTPDLATLREVLEQFDPNADLVITYMHPSNRHTERTTSTPKGARMWFEDAVYRRKLGARAWMGQSWHAEPLQFNPGEPDAVEEEPAQPKAVQHKLEVQGSVEERVGPSLVTVDFGRPFPIDGLTSESFRGTGVVVDSEKGLVVTDRMTVPSSLGTAAITFGNSQTLAAEVVFIHPDHNIAVLQYPTASLHPSIPLQAAQLSNSENVQSSDQVHLVALNSKLNKRRAAKLVSRRTRIGQIGYTKLPVPKPPAFIDSNIDLIDLEDHTASEGGVVADSNGVVLALWGAFPYPSGQNRKQFQRGLSSVYINDCLRAIESQHVATALGAELEPISLATARALQGSSLGSSPLSEDLAADTSLLVVAGRHSDAPASKLLQDGDILLQIDGESVNCFRDVEKATMAKPEVTVRLIRRGEVTSVELETMARDGFRKDRVVGWSGALCTEVPVEVVKQQRVDGRGVYVAARMPGSPASWHNLQPTNRIVEVVHTDMGRERG
eukprot:TRINITY_DN2892_c0_g1_i1.p1 TRINITY_DN2892_c0_g1~~TRINITY_DN2892_c0_g1_i1.p1  ORF type:complete len:913 (-),score=229.47 TRINITY_DN2892_c0_g1_i1:429-3167(-)